jgi:hypothetical protein
MTHGVVFALLLANGANKLEYLSLEMLFSKLQCNTYLLGPFVSY